MKTFRVTWHDKDGNYTESRDIEAARYVYIIQDKAKAERIGYLFLKREETKEKHSMAGADIREIIATLRQVLDLLVGAESIFLDMTDSDSRILERQKVLELPERDWPAWASIVSAVTRRQHSNNDLRTIAQLIKDEGIDEQ